MSSCLHATDIAILCLRDTSIQQPQDTPRRNRFSGQQSSGSEPSDVELDIPEESARWVFGAKMTSSQRRCVASSLIQRHFYVMRPLGLVSMI